MCLISFLDCQIVFVCVIECILTKDMVECRCPQCPKITKYGFLDTVTQEGFFHHLDFFEVCKTFFFKSRKRARESGNAGTEHPEVVEPVQSAMGLKMSSGYHSLMSSYRSSDDIIPTGNDDGTFVRSVLGIHDDGTSMETELLYFM